MNKNFLPYGSGLAYAAHIHGQGIDMVMGVITCVMRMDASKRRGIAVMAVFMFMITAPRFPMVNDKEDRSPV
ncbi:MAG: hypothetical protein EAZ11_06870 [Curvibacter sp.]|nr:MAG: hypothetical protein EAZ11_06870 [Curvibacter sp.]